MRKKIQKRKNDCVTCAARKLAPTCPRRWDPEEKWSDPEKYKKHPGGSNAGATLNQTGSVTPTVSEGSVPLQLTVPNQQGYTGTQMMQVPMGTQLMQVETPDGRTILVPYYGGENLSQQGTVRARIVSGTRPFIRGRQWAQFGVTNQDEHIVVRRQGDHFIMLGSISEFHYWDIDINSSEELLNLEQWAKHYAEAKEKKLNKVDIHSCRIG